MYTVRIKQIHIGKKKYQNHTLKNNLKQLNLVISRLGNGDGVSRKPLFLTERLMFLFDP